MAELYIKELEKKVAHYEATMSNCSQCMTAISPQEAESTQSSSRESRPSRSAQQAAARTPLPTSTGSLKEPAPASTQRPFARFSKPLHPASRTEPQASGPKQSPPAVQQPGPSTRSNKTTEPSVQTLLQPSINPSDRPSSGPVTKSAAEPSERPTTSTRATSTHPSSLSLSTADGRNQHKGKLVDLDLQQGKSRNQGGRPPGESPRHAAWMRTADIMLAEVPSGQQWREKLTKMNSSIIAAVAMSVVPITKGHISPTRDVEQEELIRLVRRFAERNSAGRVHFEHFILVCLCKVLSSHGVPQEKIVETLQICVSDTRKLNIDRYLKGATWANKMMNDLFFTDWGYRAVDLIAIWSRPIATYGAMASARDSRQHFFTYLTQRKYFQGYQEVPDRRHDTIPWIVKKEIGNMVSYRHICEALGYSDEYIIRTRSLHLSQPPSPNSDPGSSADKYAAPGSLSLRSSYWEKVENYVSSHQTQISPESSPSRTPSGAENLREEKMRRKQLLQDDSSDDSGRQRDPSPSQIAALQRSKRVIPDRTTKPLGDPGAGRRRRPPSEDQGDTDSGPELDLSTSLGEPAPGTQSAKRPLPDSPTSDSQPIDDTRRRRHVRERSSREEMGPPSHSGKKGSDKQGRRR